MAYERKINSDQSLPGGQYGLLFLRLPVRLLLLYIFLCYFFIAVLSFTVVFLIRTPSPLHRRRLVRMAAHHRPIPFRRRVDAQLASCREARRSPAPRPPFPGEHPPSRPVDIPAHRDHRGNAAQLVKDLRPADVTGVDDELEALSARTASGRSSPWVSEIRPIGGFAPYLRIL